MNFDEYFPFIKNAFLDNGLSDLSINKAEMFYRFSNVLIETNKITNLTAITDEKEIILKHFLDCASISQYIPLNSSLIDIGRGAGFPSIPLAILRDDLKITAIDSTGKKVRFVSDAARILSLSNLEAICTRAEEFISEHRESFDCCTSRAVARLNILSELCIPFLKIDGRFIAMKSNKGEEEYIEAASGIRRLGGNLCSRHEIEMHLDDLSISREIIVISKSRNTPTEYPRKYAQILKKPL